MSKSGPEKLKMESPDSTIENIERIGNLFPNIITEIRDEDGKIRKGIDFDLLKQELSGDFVEGREERYEFTWVGKKQSIVEGNLPIQKTLRPVMKESKNWENTQNIYIEGDNLDALKLLQESYLNSVKLIYIDPPYNTGNDFLYNDSFVMDSDEYNEETGTVDEFGNRRIKNVKDRGRYHSDWCSMLYSRLKLAHNLLRDDGIIFISIDDGEQANLRKICDEIYGSENFIATFIWEKRTTRENRRVFSFNHDYILAFAKNKPLFENVRNLLPATDEVLKRYANPDNDKRGDWQSVSLNAQAGHATPSQFYEIVTPSGRKLQPPSGRCWSVTKERFDELVADNRIWFGEDGGNVPRVKLFKSEIDLGLTPHTLWTADEVGTNDSAKKTLNSLFNDISVYDTPKPIELILRIIHISTNSGDLIVDFFAGSCTTAHAVMKLNSDDHGNRRFIMVQLPEECDTDSEAFKAGFKNISEIGKERIRRAGEEIKKEIKAEKRQAKLDRESKKILDIGFRVFKIDDTNMKEVYYSAAEYSQETIEGLVDNVKEGRTDLDLLYQVLIDWGLPIDLPHEIEKVDGLNIHTVDKNALIACFDANIPESVMKKIAGKKPLRAVFRDGSFKSSPGKLNIEGIFKTIAPDTNLRVI